MRATNMPSGIGAVGFARGDISALRDGAAAQRRLLTNAPLLVAGPQLEELFAGALCYW